MKKEFKLGDRIKVYGGYACVAGPRKMTGGCWGVSGTITATSFPDYIHFKSDEDGCEHMVHPKQCRRLVKKKRRSVWIHVLDIPNPDSWNVSACSLKGAPESDHIEFREVKVRK